MTLPYIRRRVSYEKNNQNKAYSGGVDKWRFLAGFTSCRSHKDDNTTAAPTTTEEYNITEPQTDYGPPIDFDETTTEEYDPTTEVPEDVYGPPEDFE